jgi:hypothetical protein
MKPRSVSTVRELVQALGGPKAASDFLESTPQKVVNWRAENRMPARFFLAHRSKLKSKGIKAPEALWGMHAESGAAA